VPLVANVEVVKVILGSLSHFDFDVTLVTPEAIAHEEGSYDCPQVAGDGRA
jgi:hypothetical protein